MTPENQIVVGFVLIVVAIFLAGVFVATRLPEEVYNPCIQEVHQGRTLSREAGTMYRDQRTGVWVCSRDAG